jgi:ABC-type nickel/cobalt efflux system permease component RcnA
VSVSARIVRSALTIVGVVWLALFPSWSSAHPMGNFSISHYAGIRVEGNFLEIRYFIDMAEIPTFQELQQASIVANADDPRVQAYLADRAESLKRGLIVTLDGHSLPMEIGARSILFSQGAGGLPTTKLGILYRAALTEACEKSKCVLLYRDANFAGRTGWKEIVVTPGQGMAIETSSASAEDRSGQLSNYPTDLVNSPPQELEAKIVFFLTSGAEQALSSSNTNQRMTKAEVHPRATVTQAPKKQGVPSSESVAATPSLVELRANRQSTPRNAFTELMNAKQVGWSFALLAMLVAAGLGVLHALEPGHGKTVVAAYLVGAKGTARHAFLLGLIVTTSHTVGVYLLGAVTLYAQKYILPDHIYPYLGVLSGFLIIGMGSYLFLQRCLGEGFEHTHDYGSSAQGRRGPGATGRQSSQISSRQFFVLGITGGIVPCPAALVVLLSAVALHRTAFGLLLIVAFSIGLAATLIAMGLLAVYARKLVSRFRFEGVFVQRWLPLGSAAMITILGFGVAVRGLMAAGIVQIHFWS